MKNFLLLLLLTLITGSEAGSQDFEVKACVGGWVDFICSYPGVGQRYWAVKLEGPSVNINVGKKWKHVDGLSVFHNTTSKNLRVIIRRLSNNFGEYECKFSLNSGKEREVEVKVIKAEKFCPLPPTETVHPRAQTITCAYPENLDNSWVKFLCKDNGVTCEDIFTTESSLPSKRGFNFTKTSNGFQVSIKSGSKWHKRVYWCGLKPKGGSYRVGFKQLIVEESPDESLPSKTTSTASETTSTASKTTSTASETTSTASKTTTTASETTSTASKTTTTASETTPTSPRTTCESTPSETTKTATGTTPTSSSTLSVSELKTIIPVLIAVAVLLVIVIIVYKRFKCFKSRKEGQMKTDKEERPYEEIQERPPQSNSGTVLNTIYTTAQHPTVPSAPALHSRSTGTSSGEVNDHTYSTAWDATQSPTYSTVNPPTTSCEDPFYSTLSYHSSPEEGPH